MFHQLSALASLSDTRNQQRQGQAEKHLNKGLALLQKAHDEGFRHPLRLQEAAASLIEAIKFNRGETRPYLAMAYVFLLLEDHSMAQKYVHQALTVEPDSDQVRLFQARIAEDYRRVAERRQSARTAQTAASAPAGAAFEPSRAVSSLPQKAQSDFDLLNFDFDARYDAAEARLRHLLREVMTAGALAPVSEPRELSAIHQPAQKQKQGYETILQELKVIETEIDCSDLRRLLRPIESHLKRAEQVFAISQELLLLKTKIREETALVGQLCQEAAATQDPADVEVLEENLEAFLDNADGYGRTIERLEAREPLLGDMRQVLGQLNERIETYQEALEETHVRLKV